MKKQFTPQEEIVIINAIHRHYHVAAAKLMQAESDEEEQDAMEIIKHCKEILRKCYESESNK